MALFAQRNTSHAIPLREAVHFRGFVLQHSGHEETSHAYVQYTAFAGHDVDVVALLFRHKQQIPHGLEARSE